MRMKQEVCLHLYVPWSLTIINFTAETDNLAGDNMSITSASSIVSYNVSESLIHDMISVFSLLLLKI